METPGARDEPWHGAGTRSLMDGTPGAKAHANAVATDASPMEVALAQAHAAMARNEVPVGAVVARGSEIVAAAHNETRTGNDPTAHAEILAIRRAAARLGTDRLVGLDLHVTLEPCAMCAGAIQHARLARVYYGAEDPKGGGAVNGAGVLRRADALHRAEIYGGFYEEDAAALLRRFFRERR